MKTPDFNTQEKSMEPMLFKTKLVMPELGSLYASVFNVSHNHVDGVLFPDSPVPIVGRISPETVWDYIDKMKKSKVGYYHFDCDEDQRECVFYFFISAILNYFLLIFLRKNEKYIRINKVLLNSTGLASLFITW